MKLKPREVTSLVQGHTARNSMARIQTQAVALISVLLTTMPTSCIILASFLKV